MRSVTIFSFSFFSSHQHLPTARLLPLPLELLLLLLAGLRDAVGAETRSFEMKLFEHYFFIDFDCNSSQSQSQTCDLCLCRHRDDCLYLYLDPGHVPDMALVRDPDGLVALGLGLLHLLALNLALDPTRASPANEIDLKTTDFDVGDYDFDDWSSASCCLCPDPYRGRGFSATETAETLLFDPQRMVSLQEQSVRPGQRHLQRVEEDRSDLAVEMALQASQEERH